MKPISYIATLLALAGLVACEHDEIYEPLEFGVTLDASNTYRAGDPVVFNFTGNADYITVWTGEAGHEYQHRERTSVALEDLEACELEIEISQQYGSATPEENNLDLLATDQFEGLSGTDATADRTVVAAIDNSQAADWEKLAFTPNRLNKFETYTYDISKYASNFAFALHFHQEAGTAMRTYRVNPKITVRFKGYDTQVYNYSNVAFVPFSLATLASHVSNPYIHNVSGNGNVKLAGEAGANSAANIVFQGFSAGAANMPTVNQWLMMQPIALNSISPDTGQNIKGVADDLNSFSTKYTKAGTYTATFVVSNGNYQGESKRETREVTFTVVEKID